MCLDESLGLPSISVLSAWSVRGVAVEEARRFESSASYRKSCSTVVLSHGLFLAVSLNYISCPSVRPSSRPASRLSLIRWQIDLQVHLHLVLCRCELVMDRESVIRMTDQCDDELFAARPRSLLVDALSVSWKDVSAWDCLFIKSSPVACLLYILTVFRFYFVNFYFVWGVSSEREREREKREGGRERLWRLHAL